MDMPLYLVSWFLLFGALGWLIGARKGRPFAGAVFSMLLGPLGWLIVLLGTNLRDDD